MKLAVSASLLLWVQWCEHTVSASIYLTSPAFGSSDAFLPLTLRAQEWSVIVGSLMFLLPPTRC